MLIDYLKKEFTRRKKKNSSYSLRAFAKSLNVDSSTLSKILSGKRKLSFTFAKRITESLDVDESTRNILLLTYSDTQKKYTVDEDYFVPDENLYAELMSKWEYYTTLCYLELDGRFNLENIAKKVGTEVETVKQIIDSLLKQEIIKFDKGRLIMTGKRLTTPKSFDKKSIDKVKKENIEKALAALSNKELAALSDFSGITMSISSKKLKEASEMIKVFRRSLAAFLNDPTATEDSVYRLNIDFFPLIYNSTSNNSSKKNKN